eukprot:760996-Hanusia_phi.AAC.2
MTCPCPMTGPVQGAAGLCFSRAHEREPGQEFCRDLSGCFCLVPERGNSSHFDFQLSKLSCIPATVAVQYMYADEVYFCCELYPDMRRRLFGTRISFETGDGVCDCSNPGHSCITNFDKILRAQHGVHGDPATLSYQSLCSCECCWDWGVLAWHQDWPHANRGFADDPDLMRICCGASNGSCMLSLIVSQGVNITNYQVLSKTSALTYQVETVCQHPRLTGPQVLGHLKTALTLAMGAKLLRLCWPGYALKHVSGLFLAFGGMLAYAHVRQVPSRSAAEGESGSRVSSGGELVEASGRHRVAENPLLLHRDHRLCLATSVALAPVDGPGERQTPEAK